MYTVIDRMVDKYRISGFIFLKTLMSLVTHSSLHTLTQDL